jgi:hypothetical protein
MNIFEILTIINSITLFFISIYFSKFNKIFYLLINKTFWKKIPYSITLMYITSRDYEGNWTSAKGIFTFTFRNIKKVQKLDNKNK